MQKVAIRSVASIDRSSLTTAFPDGVAAPVCPFGAVLRGVLRISGTFSTARPVSVWSPCFHNATRHWSWAQGIQSAGQPGADRVGMNVGLPKAL
ncbi:hypothetical protein SPBR_01151 [Sporothrix brasiliensis 5110]|uniref:Uncharacterized protein n=1 Tax=Sporothrix brasiliensis 5110 TaxID=1398154 RepID=A0A0C2FHJ0_9PEZI|nr:uncharacterized protein SPBR_01151 [Sporothrix brasiliensis 5110]KIH90548.1 hypothetical protein SPBR_01151 [Sporothrix brasiliensis 5110]